MTLSLSMRCSNDTVIKEPVTLLNFIFVISKNCVNPQDTMT